MKKSFKDVPSPLFTFVNGEEDADDGDVEDHPFSPFWEWILFGTEEEEKDDGRGENQLVIPSGDDEGEYPSDYTGGSSNFEFRQPIGTPTSASRGVRMANRNKVYSYPYPDTDGLQLDGDESELVAVAREGTFTVQT